MEVARLLCTSWEGFAWKGCGDAGANHGIMNLNGLDLAILAWVALGAWKGLRAGLFRSGARLAGFFLAVSLAARFSAPLGAILAERTEMDESLRAILARSGLVPREVALQPAEAGARAMQDLLSKVHLPASWVAGQVEPASTLGDYLYSLISGVLLNLLAFLIIMLAVSALTNALGGLLHGTVGRLPIVGTMDRAGGMLLGLAEHGVWAVVIVGGLAPLMQLLPTPALAAWLSGSVLAGPLAAGYQGLSSLIGF